MRVHSTLAAPATPRAAVSRLVTLLEVEYATFIVESNLFLDCVEEINRCGRPLVALDSARVRVEQFLIESSRRQCPTRNDLAVLCYAWALRRLAAGRSLAAMNWQGYSASPIDLSGFRMARVVIEPRCRCEPR